ncbi:MAG TPA: excinuclease ABC subunit C, partial [Porphyromonadaceae bacterium]|nr:excinuclease ABC subunit C [Porphyromonadaceae bacterium]
SETLKLIQQLRDEAHRFGITHHRNRRSKSQVTSELDQIKGIGKETKKKLLSHFKSVKRIKETREEEIASVVGKSKGKLITDFFKK